MLAIPPPRLHSNRHNHRNRPNRPNRRVQERQALEVRRLPIAEHAEALGLGWVGDLFQP